MEVSNHYFTLSRPESSDEIIERGDHFSSFWKEVFIDADKMGASDIHVNRPKNGMVIRARVNGVIKTLKQISDENGILETLSVRLKDICKLNTSETRMCQDSAFELSFLSSRYRVALSPSVFGESIVLRIIRENQIPCINDLGLSNSAKNDLMSSLGKKQGLITITGPTGSGKSTLMQACVSSLDLDSLNVISIEDPVERIIPGVVQQEITDRVGWVDAIKSAMRQDPDVIYIGEIRDQESAQLALEAAQTGHLVLATLHTNNVAGIIDRFIHLGIEKHLIAENMIFMSAQRLAKKSCNCLGTSDCPDCKGTGVNGRHMLFEYGLKPCPETIYEFKQEEFEKTNLITSLEHEASKAFKEGLISEKEFRGYSQ